MILIALGANLPSPRHGPPVATLEAAVEALEAAGLRIEARSPWYESAPVPLSDQPWYVNGVIRVSTGLDPEALLGLLHATERAFGRVRGAADAPRVLDLDLLAYGNLIRASRPVLPHPRLHRRAFVLVPLRDVAPAWRHPATGAAIESMLADLPPGQSLRPVLQATSATHGIAARSV